jgi:hypothetical protein
MTTGRLLPPRLAPEVTLDKIEELLARAIADATTVAPLFASLLDVDGSARYGDLALAPAQRRQRTLTALVDQLIGLANSSRCCS